MGGISTRLDGVSEDNRKLREKLKKFKENSAAMNEKIGSLQGHNQKQEKTIRALESSLEKVQRELENVKKAKEQLRIEIEEKTSTFSTKNTILTEKLEALKNDLEAVEKENKELKRSLEELTNSNNSLEQTVGLIKEENQQLKDDMGYLKAEHKEIREKLECKEARLALGQVAWLLEEEIGKAVLPGKNMGKTGILNSIKHWLKNSKSSEVKAAQERWVDLQVKLKWNDDKHTYALQCLRELRKDDAHPGNVDLEEARKQLNEGDHVAVMDKEKCAEIIEMVVTARKLNNSK